MEKNKIDMNKVSLKTLKARILAETPIFWKKIRFICISIGSIGISLKATVETNSMQFDWLQPKHYNLAILIGALGTTFASLTANTNNEKIN